jgi:XrtJ-associated TM-motif-TM protein
MAYPSFSYLVRNFAALTCGPLVAARRPGGEIGSVDESNCHEEIAMKRLKFFLAVGIALIATSPLLLHAQDGCVDSPENPTAVLALVGSVAALANYARRRFLAGRANKQDNR